MLPPETSPEHVAKSVATPEPGEAHPAVDSTELLDELPRPDTCIDRYLGCFTSARPRKTPSRPGKEKVTVKKRGRLVTVTRTFTTVAR